MILCEKRRRRVKVKLLLLSQAVCGQYHYLFQSLIAALAGWSSPRRLSAALEYSAVRFQSMEKQLRVLVEKSRVDDSWVYYSCCRVAEFEIENVVNFRRLPCHRMHRLHLSFPRSQHQVTLHYEQTQVTLIAHDSLTNSRWNFHCLACHFQNFVSSRSRGSLQVFPCAICICVCMFAENHKNLNCKIFTFRGS